MLSRGDRLGPYEILEEMGRGGMATLFHGHWSGPGGFERRVVVKVVHPEVANDPEAVRMFLDEARLSACIQHPNVVHVEGLGEHRGTHYIVMEHIQGVTLTDLLRSVIKAGEQIPLDIAVAIAAEVAKGLHAAHECTDESGRPLGIVHRDISPQNVLIDRRGFVKVIDFGIAKAEHRLARTETGATKGKIAYMSPEQLAGAEVDRQSDVFSLGVVLWETLTLQRLFRRKTDLETILAIRDAAAAPPSEHRPEVSPKLDDVVATMLARDRRERFATAAAARAALLSAHPDALRLDSPHLARFVRQVAADALVKRAPPPLPKRQGQEQAGPPRWSPADDATILEPGPPRALQGDEPTVAFDSEDGD